MPMTHTAGVMACVIYRLTGSASMRDGVRDLWADRLCQHVLAHVPEGQALRHDAAFLGCACVCHEWNNLLLRGRICHKLPHQVGASTGSEVILGLCFHSVGQFSEMLLQHPLCQIFESFIGGKRGVLSVITNSRCPLTQVECRWLALHDLEHSSCDIQKGETNLLEGECDAAEACSVLACHIGAGRWALFCERVSSELASGLKAGG
eukprot:1159341-Pelagomonas_calceolata.AAC.9